MEHFEQALFYLGIVALFLLFARMSSRSSNKALHVARTVATNSAREQIDAAVRAAIQTRAGKRSNPRIDRAIQDAQMVGTRLRFLVDPAHKNQTAQDAVNALNQVLNYQPTTAELDEEAAELTKAQAVEEASSTAGLAAWNSIYQSELAALNERHARTTEAQIDRIAYYRQRFDQAMTEIAHDKAALAAQTHMESQ